MVWNWYGRTNSHFAPIWVEIWKPGTPVPFMKVAIVKSTLFLVNCYQLLSLCGYLLTECKCHALEVNGIVNMCKQRRITFPSRNGALRDGYVQGVGMSRWGVTYLPLTPSGGHHTYGR